MNFQELRIICPLYNESGASLWALVKEWEPVLNARLTDWQWIFIDDGSSRPETIAALAAIQEQDSKFTCVRIENRGHGQACLFGYRQFYAMSRWLLQVDSDGQCRPQDFALIWDKRRPGWHHFGVREGRQDGLDRRLLSFFVRYYLGAATGVCHPDPNCPFRLLWCDGLGSRLNAVPHYLANIAVALRLNQETIFSPIGFLPRRDGKSSHKLRASLGALWEFWEKQLE